MRAALAKKHRAVSPVHHDGDFFHGSPAPCRRRNAAEGKKRITPFWAHVENERRSESQISRRVVAIAKRLRAKVTRLFPKASGWCANYEQKLSPNCSDVTRSFDSDYAVMRRIGFVIGWLIGSRNRTGARRITGWS